MLEALDGRYLTEYEKQIVRRAIRITKREMSESLTKQLETIVPKRELQEVA